MCNKTQHILAIDIGGRPFDWLHWQQAVMLYARNDVAWEAGKHAICIRGGVNHNTGLRSEILVNSIISVRGAKSSHKYDAIPSLSNRSLFARDGYVCMYCGDQFSGKILTRDHIKPRSQGGQDAWGNVITACKACNNLKGGRTPNQAGMKLLAVPYVPNHAEYLILANRRILADQMDFLKKHVPRNRR